MYKLISRFFSTDIEKNFKLKYLLILLWFLYANIYAFSKHRMNWRSDITSKKQMTSDKEHTRVLCSLQQNAFQQQQQQRRNGERFAELDARD